MKDTINPTRAGSPDGQVSEATRPVAGSEWLESDGLGGFASGPVLGPRTRRYHALLLTATTPPTGRIVLVNGFEAHVETGSRCGAHQRAALPSRRSVSGGSKHLIGFSAHPWPTWTFELGNGLVLNQEIFVARDTCETVVIWTIENCPPGYRLSLRLLMSGRDYHSLHRENDRFDFHASVQGGNVAWKPYPGLPAVTALTNGVYRDEPEWFRNFTYDDERERGLDHVEDLASPGVFTWDLSVGSAVMVLRAGDALNVRTEAYVARIVADELQRRESANSPWDAAADSYIVDRGQGKDAACRISLVHRLGPRHVHSHARIGHCPRAPFRGRTNFERLGGDGQRGHASQPIRRRRRRARIQFGGCIALVRHRGEGIHRHRVKRGFTVKPATEKRLFAAIEAILQGYAAGTRYGIAADADGLLRCGEPGVQLTWMDAKVGDFVVTPRTGKPVEVQALWINALRIGGERSPEWKDLAGKAEFSFSQRFFNPDNEGLYDVVDVDHVPGTVDPRSGPTRFWRSADFRSRS